MQRRSVATPYRMPQVKRAIPPPESLAWWWHPSRPGVSLGPEWFRSKLDAISPLLEITDDRYHAQWCIWMKKPSVQNKYCWGWNLLFTVPRAERLGDHVLARIWNASARKHGDSLQYWDTLRAKQVYEEQRAEQNRVADRDAAARDWHRNHVAIRVGYGASNGSKFSKHHAG